MAKNVRMEIDDMNEKKPAYKITLPLMFVLFVGGCALIAIGKDNQSLQTVGGLAVIASVPLIIVSIISAIRTTIRNRRVRKGTKEESVQVQSAPAKPVLDHSQPTTVSYTPPQEYHGSFLSYSYDDVRIEWDEKNYEKIKSIPIGTVLSFKRISTGQIDIYYGDMRLGGMYENRLREMAFDFLKDPDRSAMVVLISTTPINLGMYFYSSGKTLIEKLKRNNEATEYDLISNKNADMQENISFCKVGDVISTELEIEKGKYIVCSNGLEIGYMPAGYKKFLEHHGETEGRISEIIEPEEDGGKYEVSVIVIPKE